MAWVSERLSEIRVRMAPVRAWASPRLEQARQWLTAPREPLTWAALRVKLTTLNLPNSYGGRLATLGIILLLLVPLWFWYAAEKKDDKGTVTYPHASLINPILGGLGALFLIYIAIRQARTATSVARTGNRQAEIASRRHVTDTFSKAVEQLGSDKMEVRIGGIYTLERLAHEALATQQDADATTGEASDLYWTGMMETLTAFVRERTRPEAERLAKPREQRIAESAHLLWKNAGMPESRSGEFWSAALEQEARREERPATDIAAVLEVIRRRPDAGREREKLRYWRLDLRMTDLRGASLTGAHLEGASLTGAHLEGANLGGAHFERAILRWAHLGGADLRGAHLEGANLIEVHLEGANLGGAHLEGANLGGAHLARADLGEAHLEGANLGGAHLERAILLRAHLAGALLFEAHLAGAILGGAHLERAFLNRAHLAGASLIGAHLAGAVLLGADLEGADLDRAHLEGAYLFGAIGDAKTRLPDGVERPADWPPYAP